MTPDLDLTSVPAWAVEPACPTADLTGRQYSVLAVGADAVAIAQSWAAQITTERPGASPRVHLVADADSACTALDADLAGAVVGWRLLLAGPAHACLRVRARALELGASDDEITVASTEVDTREVYCAHCRTRTTAPVGLTEEITCPGCGRRLLVYYHVSRRLGAHLGFATRADAAP
ncbi:dimethylamine monooxygenase subunit DmmA family protein [Mycobacterium sp. CVI_P3]|uniref:Dimethylamine monooxygenase subunit DmmA family protein n=1 Tax=Mycobacterium pinniadriaticum TaxID=2994102 RepID=A0ABT3SGN8_9MYCO|nr:dimethylamine monooxygenase subunit DmmA family protein [Mycobacterium pinniadriaticum]MCX2932231.1 dimethylamine monooxygenase subunit DmmA family protein [Mycobacterium pinniadriaticum]MCX2938669.1 dimethylamine monooxygenase subunit DmmA family protein [Mycobacterium pinniadriaticum]